MRVSMMAGISLLGLAVLSGCQSRALPTAVSIESAQTMAAATQAAQPTFTPSPTRRAQLPPTFTPTPSETPAPTETPLPQVNGGSGRLYYLYNDDSIASVNADGTDNTIVVTLGVGQMISEYAISPDRTRIAFVAPGPGTGREVYTSDLSGANIQKLSCLGYASVQNVLWTPDSTQIVFFAAPAASGAGDIYIMQSTNGQNCPNSNSQRILAPIQASDFRGMAFNRTATRLYYAGGGRSIYAWDMVTTQRYMISSEPPFGPDGTLRQNPVTDELAFLRQSLKGSDTTGSLVIMPDSNITPEPPLAQLGDPYDALDMHWSDDGSLLMMTTAAGILVYDTREKRLSTLPLTGLRLPEAAANARDGVAYTGYDSKNVAQIFIYDLNREQTRQVTQNPDGTIRAVVWIDPA